MSTLVKYECRGHYHLYYIYRLKFEILLKSIIVSGTVDTILQFYTLLFYTM